jgi:hypothetical protein
MLQAGRSQVRLPMRSLNYSIDLILPTELWPWGLDSASNRNEYQESSCGWCVGRTTLLPSMSRLFRQCGILNISQPYRPPRPVTGIALHED